LYVGYPNQFGRSGNIGIEITGKSIFLYDLTRTGNIYASNSSTSSGDKVRGLEIKYPYVYIGNGDLGILTVNMSNYASVVKYTPYPTGGYTYDVELLEDTLVVAANGLRGVGIYRIVDDTTFSLVGECQIVGYAYELELRGDRLYVGSRSGGFSIVDITDRTTPVVVGRYDGYSEMRGFCISGDRLYAAGGEGGLNIYDISDRQEPKFISKTYGRFISEDVKVEGNYAYIAEADSGLTIMDISDENNPYVVGSTLTSYYGRTVDVSGDVCVCGGIIEEITTPCGISLVDVSTKSNPIERNQLMNGFSEIDFEMRDSLFYCKGNPLSTGYFEIWNLNDILTPVLVDSFITSQIIRDYDMNDEALYICRGGTYVTYYDITNPANVVFLDTTYYYDYVNDIGEVGEYLAVTLNDSMQIWNYTDPYNPIEVYSEYRNIYTTENGNDGNNILYMSFGFRSPGYLDRGRYGLKIYACLL